MAAQLYAVCGGGPVRVPRAVIDPVIEPALLEEVRPLADRFESAGFALYLVGGIVRDQILGRPLPPVGDIDLTTDARPDDVRKLVSGIADAVWTQGERFGTIGCRVRGREYEITTHRGESYHPGSRKPFVEFADAIDEDLSRRDFTVNAMAVSLPGGTFVDPFGGREDLRNGRLRTPLAAEVSFSDDPLRMLRAARFVAGYGLEPDSALVAALDALAPRMAIVSVERRRDELDKLLVLLDPTAGLRLVIERGLAPFVLPDLAAAPRDVVERALRAATGLPPVLHLRLAALAAPTDDPDAAAIARRLRELRYSNATIRAVGAVVSGAALVWRDSEQWDAPRIRRLAAAAGEFLDDAISLASTRVDTAELRLGLAELRRREPLDALDLPLDGDEVMALLGLEAGVAVGEALAHLLELRIEHGPIDADDARARLVEWWSSRSG